VQSYLQTTWNTSCLEFIAPCWRDPGYYRDAIRALQASYQYILPAMKISIITATYNSSAHMAGCHASVNNQPRQVNHAGQTRHTMTQSHGMTNSK
jgi:hypothetical protein